LNVTVDLAVVCMFYRHEVVIAWWTARQV